MKKARILYGLWLVIAAAYGIFSTDYYALTVLPFSILLPVFFGILTKRALRHVTVRLEASGSVQKGETADIRIYAKNGGFFPLDRVMLTLKGENLLTGETMLQKVRLGIPAKQEVSVDAQIREQYCGKMRISISRIQAFDPAGLLTFKKPCDVSDTILWRPHTFDTDLSISYGESMNLDSDEYSMRKAGFDPSETFAIREYRPGDSIRQIHWKLSEKMETLTVRDYGLPIQNTILLLLDTGMELGTKAVHPARMDAVMEAFLSFSQELAQQGIAHSIAWQNHEDGSFYLYEIGETDELLGLLSEILGAAAGEDPMSALGHYLEQTEQCDYAHVAILAVHGSPETRQIENSALVHEFLCEEAAAGQYQEGAKLVTSFTAETVMSDLAYAEI